MPKAAANEIKADDFTHRPNVMKEYFQLPYPTIYLGCLPQKTASQTLPRAIRSEQAKHFSRLNLKIDSLDGLHVAIRLLKSLYRDRCRS